jgi:protein kinase C substrate 80K-H
LVDSTEALSAAALEHKKKSRPFYFQICFPVCSHKHFTALYASLETHSDLLESLLALHEAQIARTKVLEDILDSLRTGYNPNYQDMAVLEAVRGWEQVAGLPHINDVKKDAEIDETTSEDLAQSEDKANDINPDELKKEIEQILRTDRISLLVEHDKHVGHSGSSAKSLRKLILSCPSFFSLMSLTVFDVSSYIPDSLLPEYEAASSTLSSWLSTFGIVSKSGEESADATRARQSFTAAETELNRLKKEFQDAQEDLKDLFDPTVFGKRGEWKKLQGTCLSKDTGE